MVRGFVCLIYNLIPRYGWLETVESGTPQFGLVWFGLVWFGLVWVGLGWFGLVWFGLVWFGLVWFGLVWFGLVWFGLVWFPIGKCTHLRMLNSICHLLDNVCSLIRSDWRMLLYVSDVILRYVMLSSAKRLNVVVYVIYV